jgi:hypothetical protein
LFVCRSGFFKNLVAFCGSNIGVYYIPGVECDFVAVIHFRAG